MIAPVPSLQAPSASISERKRPDMEAATGLEASERATWSNAPSADVPGYEVALGETWSDLPEGRLGPIGHPQHGMLHRSTLRDRGGPIAQNAGFETAARVKGRERDKPSR